MTDMPRFPSLSFTGLSAFTFAVSGAGDAPASKSRSVKVVSVDCMERKLDPSDELFSQSEALLKRQLGITSIPDSSSLFLSDVYLKNRGYFVSGSLSSSEPPTDLRIVGHTSILNPELTVQSAIEIVITSGSTNIQRLTVYSCFFAGNYPSQGKPTTQVEDSPFSSLMLRLADLGIYPLGKSYTKAIDIDLTTGKTYNIVSSRDSSGNTKKTSRPLSTLKKGRFLWIPGHSVATELEPKEKITGFLEKHSALIPEDLDCLPLHANSILALQVLQKFPDPNYRASFLSFCSNLSSQSEFKPATDTKLIHGFKKLIGFSPENKEKLILLFNAFAFQDGSKLSTPSNRLLFNLFLTDKLSLDTLLNLRELSLLAYTETCLQTLFTVPDINVLIRFVLDPSVDVHCRNLFLLEIHSNPRTDISALIGTLKTMTPEERSERMDELEVKTPPAFDYDAYVNGEDYLEDH